MLLAADRTELPPAAFLAEAGEVFVVFDRQDSGNVAYGVRVGAERFFVKTAGGGDAAAVTLAERIALLRNAVQVSAVAHAALAPLRHVVESPGGPLLVYDWLDGELVGTERARRSDPTSAWARFRALPPGELLTALDTILDLHDRLAAAGWIAVDFYDGSLLYDFAAGALHVVDLDNYNQGAFINERGRMFGSTRFMAPEEFQRGARIDQRTNVFTLGRTIVELLSDGTLEPAPFRAAHAFLAVAIRACQPDPRQRFASVAEFHRAWRALRADAA